MSPLASLLQALLVKPAVTALAGSRIFAEMAPQGAALPHVLLRLANVDEDHALARAGAHRSSMVTVIVLGKSYSEADAIAEAIRDAAADFDLSGIVVVKGDLDASDYTMAGPVPTFRRFFTVRVSTA